MAFRIVMQNIVKVNVAYIDAELMWKYAEILMLRLVWKAVDVLAGAVLIATMNTG